MFKKNLSQSIVLILGIVFISIGLRVYDNFIAVNTAQITTQIVELFPGSPRWSVFWSVSVLLKVPLIVTNSVTVGLLLSIFFHRTLWKYGLVVGILSEIIWVLVWGVYIWNNSLSFFIRTPILLEQAMAVVGPAIAGYYIGKIINKWPKE
jgi:hypothetical protein